MSELNTIQHAAPGTGQPRTTLVIAGGRGFLGRALAEAAHRRGMEVVILSRSPERWRGPGRAVWWDGRTRGAWEAALDGAAAVVNLAGKNVDCRYTKEALAEIDRSRVESVRAVGDALHQAVAPPAVWIQAGTLAIYGDAGDRWCDEDAPLGEGIPPATARQWEAAFAHSPTPRTRRVLFRISFVLQQGAGALRRLERLTRLGLGGAIGNGRQFVSWIHVDDFTRAVFRAIDDPGFSGVYNLTSPEPVPNADFMAGLRHALHRPWAPPAPRWLVRAGCRLLRTEPVLALTGRRGDPRRLEEAGFTFRFPTLRSALADLFTTHAGLKEWRLPSPHLPPAS